MASIPGNEHLAPESKDGVKRRRLLAVGTLVTAFTGISTISGMELKGANAAPGDKNPPSAYVPIAEKGVASGVATLDTDSKIPSAQLPNLSATYASVGDVKARAHLVTGQASSAADLAALQSAVNTAAAAGATLLVRGAFTLSGGTVAPTGEVHIDAENAVFTQSDNLRPIFNLPANSSLTGGKAVGKGSDWINTSAVYSACAVQVSANDVTVRDFVAENMAGAGVFAPVAVSGLRVLDCFFDGVGPSIIPASKGQYSGGVVFGINGVTGFTLRGGRYRGFAQGVVGGNVSDFFVGGGLELAAVGQHGLYLGAVDGGSVSGLRVNGVPLQGVKAQLSNAGASDTELFTIGDVVIRGNGSHGVLLTNVDSMPTSYNRRVSVHDVVVEHATGGTGDTVALLGVSNASVHDVIGVGGLRGLRAVESNTLNVHHNSFSNFAQSGMCLTSVTDSDVGFNALRNGGTANDPADEFGFYVTGARSADLRFAHNRIADSAGNLKYAFYIAAGDLSTMSFTGNTSAGVSDYGFRSGTTTNTRVWLGNDLRGLRGQFFNVPSNAAAIADTSAATLAALEAEVNKIKARMRLSGTVNS